MPQVLAFEAQSAKNTELSNFILRYGDHRITTAARKYFELPDGPGVGVFIFFRHPEESGKNVLVSFSGARLYAGRLNGGTTDHSITVTASLFRNEGLGTEALARKIEYLKVLGGSYEAVVAADNVPSNRICEKNSLVVAGTIARARRDGAYLANVYTELTTVKA